MQNKFDKLKNYIKELGKQGVCLAFSGGIDSTLLLYICKEAEIPFIAVTFESVFQTKDEINLTKELCLKYDVKQVISKCDISQNPYLLKNPKDRCYHCKKILFQNAFEIAKENNLKNVIDGTNLDDLKEYRPGLKALKESGVISPFAVLGITKKKIREYAGTLGIEIFDKPSTPCLATRLPYGDDITKEKLKIIENGEAVLKENGFDSARLRLHGDIARIEILPEKFGSFMVKKTEIINRFKNLGIKYVTLDIEGFRSGSMGE